jgi:hypothetical protein
MEMLVMIGSLFRDPFVAQTGCDGQAGAVSVTH